VGCSDEICGNRLDEEFQEFNEFKELARRRKKYDEGMKKKYDDEEWYTQRMSDEVEVAVEVEMEVEDAASWKRRELRLSFEGFAQGVEGFVLERRLLMGNWGFRFEDLMYDRVQMWHGSRERFAPVESIRFMAERMPYCVLTEFDDTRSGMSKHFERAMKEMKAEVMKNGVFVGAISRARRSAAFHWR